MKLQKKRFSSSQMIILGFAAVILVGALLLMLPLSYAPEMDIHIIPDQAADRKTSGTKHRHLRHGICMDFFPCLCYTELSQLSYFEIKGGFTYEI